MFVGRQNGLNGPRVELLVHCAYDVVHHLGHVPIVDLQSPHVVVAKHLYDIIVHQWERIDQPIKLKLDPKEADEFRGRIWRAKLAKLVVCAVVGDATFVDLSIVKFEVKLETFEYFGLCGDSALHEFFQLTQWFEHLGSADWLPDWNSAHQDDIEVAARLTILDHMFVLGAAFQAKFLHDLYQLMLLHIQLAEKLIVAQLSRQKFTLAIGSLLRWLH